MIARTLLIGPNSRSCLRQTKKIILRDQAYEIEVELPGRGFYSEADVGHIARDIRRHGSMREFDLLIAIDARDARAV